MREIILDTETTGLDPKTGHRIVEIGAIEMINKVVTGKKFHYYLDPQRDMPYDAYKIHGLSSAFLKGKPLFKDISLQFLEFIQDGKLVIHNASFDIKFLNHELGLSGLPSIEFASVIDTLAIARKKFPGARVNLDALCKKFRINNSNRQLHGALKDAHLLAEVYVELCGGRQISFTVSGVSSKQLATLDIIIQDESRQAATKGNGIVIVPSDEELSAHQEFMAKLTEEI